MTSSFLSTPHEVKPSGPPLNQPLQPAVLFRSSADAERRLRLNFVFLKQATALTRLL